MKTITLTLHNYHGSKFLTLHNVQNANNSITVTILAKISTMSVLAALAIMSLKAVKLKTPLPNVTTVAAVVDPLQTLAPLNKNI